MPDEAKKKLQKGRYDPKEQRRPRQRNQAGPDEQKTYKKKEELQVAPKSVTEEPGPDFFKNLKRETDEILKITAEENLKYKKKEIQSNWSKYEVQIESYDDIQEQENMGADYETLIQAPLSIGGHFQFKHEKSWDVDVGPSPYDKYFEINMDSLFLAISSLPFNVRNNIPKDLLNEQDILSINNRATKCKQKYYNDTIMTRDIELQAKNSSDTENGNIQKGGNYQKLESNNPTEKQTFSLENNDINIDSSNNLIHTENILVAIDKESSNLKTIEHSKNFNIGIDNIDDLIEGDIKTINENIEIKPFDTTPINDTPKVAEIITVQSSVTDKNPAVESAEDLEKWLDDFLDG